MALPKFGEPRSEWVQDRAHAGSVYNAFGVLDAEGAAIPGLQVEFSVFRAQRTAQEKYTFSLRRFEFGVLQRIYQQEINTRPRLRLGDHAWSHEHVGDLRVPATSDWSTLSLAEAVERFCRTCNLKLTEPLPDIDAFELR